MSTQQQPSKLTSIILFISGVYLFFVTLVIAPYVNFTVFSTFHITTKLLLVTIAGVISTVQLLLAVPSLKKGFLRKLGRITNIGVYVSLIGVLLSIVFSASLKTSLFGMFTSWENNLVIFVVYGLLLLSWTTFFLALKRYELTGTVFHTLMNLGIIVAIIYSVGEYYIWKPSTGYISQSVSRISLGFRNPLFAAYFLGMLWSYSFAQLFELFVQAKKTANSLGKSTLGVLLYVGITFSLILTFTRSALLAAGICAVLVILINFFMAIRDKKGIARVSIVAALLLVIAFTIGYGYRKEFSQRNTDMASESQNTLSTIATSLGKDSDAAMNFYQNASQYSSSQIRILEWKWGLRTWMGSVKNFLFGTGPDTGFFEMPKYRESIFNNFPTDSATKPFYVRSLFINTLMQFGIVASVGFVLLCVGLLKKYFASSEKDLSAFALVLGFFAQGIFYYPTHLTVVLFLFALSYLFSLPKRDAEETVIRRPNSQEKILLIATAVGLLFWITPIIRAEYIISTYTQTALPAPVQEMEKNAGISIDNNVLKRFLVYHYPENETSAKILPQLAVSKDVDDLRIASDAYYILARKSNSKELTLSSISVFNKLLAIDSTLPATWDGLGLRYLFIGDFAKARESFNKALELKPDYWYAYMHLGETSRQQCNPKEALDWYKKAEQYIPTAENEIQEATTELKTPREECK